jgi:hypothetical protein
LPLAAMFVNGSELNEHVNGEHDIDASYHVSVH